MKPPKCRFCEKPPEWNHRCSGALEIKEIERRTKDAGAKKGKTKGDAHGKGKKLPAA